MSVCMKLLYVIPLPPTAQAETHNTTPAYFQDNRVLTHAPMTITVPTWFFSSCKRQADSRKFNACGRWEMEPLRCWDQDWVIYQFSCEFSDLYGREVVCISCIPLTLNGMLLLSRPTFGSEEITSDINISKKRKRGEGKVGFCCFHEKEEIPEFVQLSQVIDRHCVKRIWIKIRINLNSQHKFYSWRWLLSGNHKNIMCTYLLEKGILKTYLRLKFYKCRFYVKQIITP